MNIRDKYITRCIELAKNGLEFTRPNPMVGCVIVYQGKIIGEGFTSPYGGDHAEVNAINSVKNKNLLTHAELFVSLEPCVHYGKTPPCTELILAHKIPKVFIGALDPFEEVAGKGIERLRQAGCEVVVGILEENCIALNKHFFTYHRKKRPYIILKWAQSNDGFLDKTRKALDKTGPNWISNQYSRQLVHKWRSETQAVLVGTNTVINDNPKLSLRDWKGSDPVRIVLDRSLRIPETFNVLDGSLKTIIITEVERTSKENLHFEKVNFSESLTEQICEVLFKYQIQSVLLEGGRQILETFIHDNLWDEARIFTGAQVFNSGLAVPQIEGELLEEAYIKNDHLKILKNKNERFL